MADGGRTVHMTGDRRQILPKSDNQAAPDGQSRRRCIGQLENGHWACLRCAGARRQRLVGALPGRQVLQEGPMHAQQHAAPDPPVLDEPPRSETSRAFAAALQPIPASAGKRPALVVV